MESYNNMVKTVLRLFGKIWKFSHRTCYFKVLSLHVKKRILQFRSNKNRLHQSNKTLDRASHSTSFLSLLNIFNTSNSGIGCVSCQNRSQTRRICRIYIPGGGLFYAVLSKAVVLLLLICCLLFLTLRKFVIVL